MRTWAPTSTAQLGACVLLPLRGMCQPWPVGPTTFDARSITSANVRVPRDEFVRTWREAVRREGELAGQEVTDWYVGAVAQTCRWLAAVPMRTALCGGLPRSPVTLRSCLAHEQSIEAEWQAAQRPDQFPPEIAARPGWCEGVRATFQWAWCRDGPPPVEVPSG